MAIVMMMEYSRSYPFPKQSNLIEDEFHHVLSNGTIIKCKLGRVELYVEHNIYLLKGAESL
jgi:hypothetical protein